MSEVRCLLRRLPPPPRIAGEIPRREAAFAPVTSQLLFFALEDMSDLISVACPALFSPDFFLRSGAVV